MLSDAETLQAFGRLPSVTQILAVTGLGPDYSRVPRHLLEHAGQRGTALHAAIQLYHEGDLDEESLHPEVATGFSAYRKFLAESRFEFLAGEFEVRHDQWLYLGHPDLLGSLGGKRVLLDTKFMDTVHLVAAAYQLTLYRLAWEAQHPDQPIHDCYVLQFKHDGTFRLWPVASGPAEERTCYAAIVVFRAIEAGR